MKTNKQTEKPEYNQAINFIITIALFLNCFSFQRDRGAVFNMNQVNPDVLW